MTKLKELANGNTLFNRNFTDSLRGIAILLVITSHIAGAIGTNLCTPLGRYRSCTFSVLIWIWIKRIIQSTRFEAFLDKKNNQSASSLFHH